MSDLLPLSAATSPTVTGGKATNLARLAQIVPVPPGFVVTTDAWARVVAPHLDPGADPAAARAAIAALPLPNDLVAAIAAAAPAGPLAVRSSATTEDGADASFAGQYDSVLGVVGIDAIVAAIRTCWASLYTDRAVVARRGGPDAAMAVIVQALVDADAAGVMFTADPVTGNRRTVVIEATVGLAEALVAGHAPADAFRVRDGVVTAELVAKPTAVRPHGPTAVADPTAPSLTDDEARALAALGRTIEAHFGAPQDIEWCRTAAGFTFVQARPITTLFPIPPGDGPRVYLSVGHAQMMTDAMSPLGVSLFQRAALRPMVTAGGRLFVDITAGLAAPTPRAGLLAMIGAGDPRSRDALEAVLATGLVPTRDDPPMAPPPALPPLAPDPALPAAVIADAEAGLAAFQPTGDGFDAIDADLRALKGVIGDPRTHRMVFAVADALRWLDEQLTAWLGEAGLADRLTRAVPHDVTAELGLDLLDVADVLRDHPAAVAALEAGDLDALAAFPDAHAAVTAWLGRYGHRGVGEIDVARPRWAEDPAALAPLLIGPIRAFARGEAARRVAAGRAEAARTAADVLARLDPDRAAEARLRIDQIRAFAGFREYPKHAMMARFFAYKRVLLAEADRLVGAGLATRDDAFFLTFDELHEAARAGHVDPALIRARRAEFRRHAALRPPRVLTSDGDALDGAYRRDDVPAGALAGLSVSAGVVEGRARVLFAPAPLAPGDILVTPYTDPAWAPAFHSVAGLVTEVGGRMTHGAVIARELGLPAIVGVTDATRRIRDGQRLRLDATAGWVLPLD